MAPAWIGRMATADWNAIDSPRDLAERLWTFDALELPPRQFRALANRVWNNTRNAKALWKLGGAIHDYLRHRPNSISVPDDLPWILLAARQCDARIVGLKLLKHSNVDDETMLTEVLRALDRGRNYERCGGIHELNAFLDVLGDRRLPTASRILRRVKRRLEELSIKMPRVERDFAAAVLTRLELASEQ